MDRISALMDGELAREEAARLVADIRAKDGLRETWAVYHLIGEALRREPCRDCGVVQSVSKRLEGEPTVLAPRRITGEIGRRWALPGMAAAAAIVSVTWMAVETYEGGSGQPAVMPVSQMIVPAVAVHSSTPWPEYAQAVPVLGQSSAPAPIQFSAREFDAYLRAHQEFSPSTTLQGLAPYVRAVTTGAGETGR
jgi:sigma-E factor negative regulatory protein RseA